MKKEGKEIVTTSKGGRQDHPKANSNALITTRNHKINVQPNPKNLGFLRKIRNNWF